MAQNLTKLKNGTTEVQPFVVITLGVLKQLFDDKPLAFFDLVSKCRDSSYKWFGDNEQICRDLQLIQPENPYNPDAGGSIHESIKNIVLSAAEGEGMDMTLVSPYAVEQKNNNPSNKVGE